MMPKVAQKQRTASLTGGRSKKPKTDAARVKHFPSPFLNAFLLRPRHDRQGGRFSAADAKCGLFTYLSPATITLSSPITPINHIGLRTVDVRPTLWQLK